MAGSVNKVILVGNVGNEPEIRTFQNGGRVANLSLATSENWKDKNTGERREKTEWHRVVVWGKQAEIAGEYLRKGRQVYIEGSLHAREYTTAELGIRMAEHLVTQYGLDADVTWLLDHHEIHFNLQANPDGRKRAETGLSWRKNANNDHCSNSNSRGIDLNRNFPAGNFRGRGSGGKAALSEPESRVLFDLITAEKPARNASVTSSR